MLKIGFWELIPKIKEISVRMQLVPKLSFENLALMPDFAGEGRILYDKPVFNLNIQNSTVTDFWQYQ